MQFLSQIFSLLWSRALPVTAIALDAGVAVKYCCMRALTLVGWVGCQDTLRYHCSCCAWAVLKCSLSLQLSDLVGYNLPSLLPVAVSDEGVVFCV